MMVKAICPTHGVNTTFITVAHVTQDWEVDSDGDFLATENECGETTHYPDRDNTWQCKQCGADAFHAEIEILPLTSDQMLTCNKMLKGSEAITNSVIVKESGKDILFRSFCNLGNNQQAIFQVVNANAPYAEVIFLKQGYEVYCTEPLHELQPEQTFVWSFGGVKKGIMLWGLDEVN